MQEMFRSEPYSTMLPSYESNKKRSQVTKKYFNLERNVFTITEEGEKEEYVLRMSKKKVQKSGISIMSRRLERRKEQTGKRR